MLMFLQKLLAERVESYPLILTGSIPGVSFKRLTLIPTWISKYIHYKVWNEITYSFTNFNGTTVKVWEWINNFILDFIGHVITYPCWD